MERIDVLIVGGGLVGLAAGAQIALEGRSVCVLERHPRFGAETSTHNSGVIHAGLYQPVDSLKTRLTIEGRPALYEFCDRHGVPHARCGKLIVATDSSELDALERLYRHARANGVERLEIVEGDEVRRREPHVRAAAALWSPDSGIVEAEALVKALEWLCTDRGVHLLPGTPAVGAAADHVGINVTTPRETIRAGTVVNAAGLYADEVSRLVGGDSFTIYPCRGDYAELAPARRKLVNGLVYPLPHHSGHGLGVHFTRTTGGSVLVGPTIRYVESKSDYESHREPLEEFYKAAKIMLPSLEPGDLQPGGSGIRPKLHPPQQSFEDFLIARDRTVPRLVHAAGIDSPGLTACLAIGKMVAGLVGEVH